MAYTNGRVTAELEGSKDSFIFGGKYGFGIAKKAGGSDRLIQKFWTAKEENNGKPEYMRANDGAVDSRGRFWVSAICDPHITPFKPEGEPLWPLSETQRLIIRSGVLFRLDNDGAVHRMIEGVTIGNGISWSRDDKTMYFTETMDGTIYAYDFDSEAGEISNKRVFFKAEGGGPDGHAQDEEGNFWVAVWGSWKVLRVNPEGEVTAEVNMPTRCPTVSSIP